MNEIWSTELPPSNLGNVSVLVCCGNGETTTMNASDLKNENHGICWIAWKSF